MKLYRLIIYMAMACAMAGCTITGQINRKGMTAEILHSTKKQREYIEEKQEEQRKGYIEYTRADSSKVFLVPATVFDGETMMQFDIGEVVVTASSRTLPERKGKVSIDFVVTLPKELMGNCRGVEVTPVLHKSDESIPL